MVDRSVIETSRVWVAGQWWVPSATAILELQSPSRLEPIGRVAICAEPEVDGAVRAAHGAQSAWASLDVAERSALLTEIGARIRERHEAIATTLSREIGQPMTETREGVLAVAQHFMAPLDRRVGDPAEARPVGPVVAVLTPHTAPLTMLAHSVVPSLLAGATVIVKPPPHGSLATLLLASLFDGLPSGVFNVLTGDATTGRLLAEHPGVAGVSFAGSSEQAAVLASSLASLGKPCWAATGGKDAVVVGEDAALADVMPMLVGSRFHNGGRSCTAIRRIYVHRDLFDAFVLSAHTTIAELEFGEPLEATTDVGPLVSKAAARRVEDQVGRLLRAGVGLVLGGMRFRPCGLPGYFFQPTILTRGRAPAEALREEILGPVLVVSPVDSVQEGLEQALADGDASRVTLCSSSEPLTARQRESGRCFVGSPPSDAVARSQLSVPGMAVSWAPSPRVLTFPYRLMSGNTPATRGDAGG